MCQQEENCPYQVIRASGAVYIARCAVVEVIPWVIHQSQKNCTEEILTLHRGTEIFMDLISGVIKLAGSSAHCNDVASLCYKLGRKWYCSYPELRECHDPVMMPVDKVQIESLGMSDISLGKSIYTKKHHDEFAAFQGIQGICREYLAETV
jgi:hypothetical protein